MIYLASPYTAASPLTMETRYLEACAAVAELTFNNLTVYSPIVHYHVVARFGELPTDFTFWQHHNRHMIQLASELWALASDGWEKSVGMAAEVEYAAELNKPIFALYRSGNGFARRTWAEQVGDR